MENSKKRKKRAATEGGLDRVQIQKLAKKNGIAANGKTKAMAMKLRDLGVDIGHDSSELANEEKKFVAHLSPFINYADSGIDEAMLLPETIASCNEIVKGLTMEDQGIVVQVPDVNQLHIAAGFATSPFPQGVDANASLLAFRGWLMNQALLQPGINQSHVAPGPSAWHHLSARQATEIVGFGWHNPSLPWLLAIRGAPAPGLGHVAEVIIMSGTGPGRADMYLAFPVFY